MLLANKTIHVSLKMVMELFAKPIAPAVDALLLLNEANEFPLKSMLQFSSLYIAPPESSAELLIKFTLKFS